MDYAAQSRGYEFEPPNRSEPTQARPGSAQKLQVMAERFRSGQPLHHPNDETLVSLPVRKAMWRAVHQIVDPSRDEEWQISLSF